MPDRDDVERDLDRQEADAELEQRDHDHAHDHGRLTPAELDELRRPLPDSDLAWLGAIHGDAVTPAGPAHVHAFTPEPMTTQEFNARAAERRRAREARDRRHDRIEAVAWGLAIAGLLAVIAVLVVTLAATLGVELLGR